MIGQAFVAVGAIDPGVLALGMKILDIRMAVKT
jgi:hypothetical protein